MHYVRQNKEWRFSIQTPKYETWFIFVRTGVWTNSGECGNVLALFLSHRPWQDKLRSQKEKREKILTETIWHWRVVSRPPFALLKEFSSFFWFWVKYWCRKKNLEILTYIKKTIFFKKSYFKTYMCKKSACHHQNQAHIDVLKKISSVFFWVEI